MCMFNTRTKFGVLNFKVANMPKAKESFLTYHQLTQLKLASAIWVSELIKFRGYGKMFSEHPQIEQK